MKRAILFVIYLLLIGAAIGILVAECCGQTMQREPTSITLTSRVGTGDWLVIERYNEKESPDGFSPCYTAIRCAYKPVVRTVDGVWVIEFVSELAQDLP